LIVFIFALAFVIKSIVAALTTASRFPSRTFARYLLLFCCQPHTTALTAVIVTSTTTSTSTAAAAVTAAVTALGL
jgi:hypothetical protein